MNGLKKLFDFYLDASMHVAGSVFALVYVVGFLLELQDIFALAWFLFCGTIVSYNFMKYGVEAKKYLIVVGGYRKGIQLISFAAFGYCFYSVWFFNIETLIAIVVLVLISGVYILPVLPKISNFRRFGGLKIIIVALVWAGGTVILPVLNEERSLDEHVLILLVQVFLLVLVLILPFEIRDLKYDAVEMQTIPQRFGIFKTKLVGALIVLVICGLELFGQIFIIENTIVLFATISLALVLLLYTKKDPPKYYVTFWVESVPMFWCLGLYFSTSVFS